MNLYVGKTITYMGYWWEIVHIGLLWVRLSRTDSNGDYSTIVVERYTLENQ